MDRTEAIIVLEGFKDNPLFNSTHAQAFDMAIASLKTDEAYQLEYESRDFVEIPKGMTNGEAIQALFPEVRVEIDGFLVRCVFIEHEFTTTEKWWNSPYQKGAKYE